MPKPKIAIVGYGQFGRFAAKHLRLYATVIPIEIDTDPKKAQGCSYVIFAIPFQHIEAAIIKLKPHITEDALILDVTSVKQKPLALLKKSFPNNQLLGTHPIFGPQSGKNGIEGFTIVLSNVSFSKSNYTKVKQFLKNKLKLHILEQTAKQHDEEMARVQALTHLIGQLLYQLDVQSFKTNTKSYEQLLELRDLLKNDTWELFETIQNANPEAKKMRKRFTAALSRIEKKLEK